MLAGAVGAEGHRVVVDYAGGGFFEPRADAGVGELGAVADDGAGDFFVEHLALGADGEAHHDGEAVAVFVERGDAGGELEGEHGEVFYGGVDGLGLLLGVLVDGRALVNGGGYVADGNAEEDAAGDAIGYFDLIEVAGGVVVDGGPAEGAEVFYAGLGLDNGELFDDGDYLLGDAGGELGLETGFVHLVEGGGGEVEVAVLLVGGGEVVGLLVVLVIVVLLVVLLVVVFVLRGCVVGVAIVSGHEPQTNTLGVRLAWAGGIAGGEISG